MKMMCFNKIFVEDKRYNIVFPKRRKQWVARPLLEGKNYNHLFTMMDDVIQLRLHDKSRIDRTYRNIMYQTISQKNIATVAKTI